MIEVLKAKSRGGIIILCDHASNHVPDHLDGLGLTQDQLDDHIAWDPGAADVARVMSELMDVPAILGGVSRLVIDCNREPDHATLIPVVSDGVTISGNRGLSMEECQQRMDDYYHSFHDATEALVQEHLDEGIVPIIVAMHSFTPNMSGQDRPWHISFLWNKDPRLAQAMIGFMERETDLTVGDNVPYTGKELYYTMQRHGADRGLPQTTVEIRQDMFKTEQQVREWAALMCDALDEMLARDDVRSIQHF